MNKKLLLSIFMAVIVYMTLVVQNYMDNFNVLFIFCFIIFIIFLKNSDLFNKEYRKPVFLLSLFLAVLFLVGRVSFNFRYNTDYSVWGELFHLKSVFYIAGYLSLFYGLFINIVPKLVESRAVSKLKFKMNTNIFLVSSIIIFLCWIPYFLIYFPGLFSADSIGELKIVVSNFQILRDHHPIIHQLFVFFTFKLGMLIFNNSTIAASLISLTQMIIMALIFGYAINFMYKRDVNKKIIIMILLYFALVPIHAFYSMTMWKDIIFAGCVLLLTIELIKLFEKKNITFKNSYSFIIVSLFTVFFRNNAIYMYFILAIITLIVFRKQLKIFLLMFIVIFGSYFIIKGPVFNYFGVQSTESAEYLAMPLQQIGRMAYKGVKFNNEEKKLINKLIPLKTLKKVYNPESVDHIKFNNKYNSKEFEDNKGKYLKLWVNLCFKHFDIASEAYLISTLGYWFPNVNSWTMVTRMEKNNLGIYDRSFLPDSIKIKTDLLTDKEIPLYNFVWCIGLCFWVLLVFAVVAIIRKNKRALFVYVPIFGIWLTMLVAAPVFAEFRYVYSAFTCLPVLLLAPYIVKRQND